MAWNMSSAAYSCDCRALSFFVSEGTLSSSQESPAASLPQSRERLCCCAPRSNKSTTGGKRNRIPKNLEQALEEEQFVGLAIFDLYSFVNTQTC